MEKVLITKDTMASMIVCDRRLEEIPQPCRGQRNLNLVIPFDQYIDFVSDYEELSKYLLSGKFMNVSKVIQMSKKTESDSLKKELYKAYLMDVAVAVGKEVWYSDGILNVVSTQISHTMPTGKVMTPNEVISFKENGSQYAIIQNFLEEHGYCKIGAVSVGNILQKKYIGMLVQSAFGYEPWSLKI